MKKDFHRSEKAFSSRWKKFFTPMEKEANHEQLSFPDLSRHFFCL